MWSVSGPHTYIIKLTVSAAFLNFYFDILIAVSQFIQIEGISLMFVCLAIFGILGPLQKTYEEKYDKFGNYSVQNEFGIVWLAVPCLVLAVLFHPWVKCHRHVTVWSIYRPSELFRSHHIHTMLKNNNSVIPISNFFPPHHHHSALSTGSSSVTWHGRYLCISRQLQCFPRYTCSKSRQVTKVELLR